MLIIVGISENAIVNEVAILYDCNYLIDASDV